MTCFNIMYAVSEFRSFAFGRKDIHHHTLSYIIIRSDITTDSAIHMYASFHPHMVAPRGWSIKRVTFFSSSTCNIYHKAINPEIIGVIVHQLSKLKDFTELNGIQWNFNYPNITYLCYIPYMSRYLHHPLYIPMIIMIFPLRSQSPPVPIKPYLIGGFKHVLFAIIYGTILPIDELIIFQDD